MLYFSINSLFRMRGIENAHGSMVKAGISPHSASSLLNSEIRSMRLDHLEKICILLNCTPNDLLVWKAGAHSVLPENHALKALQPKPETYNLYQTLRDLPINELRTIAGLIRSNSNNSSDK
jgi:DNA-binding Xre family transcriptional regulator